MSLLFSRLTHASYLSFFSYEKFFSHLDLQKDIWGKKEKKNNLVWRPFILGNASENILCFSSQEQLYNICCLNSFSAPIKDCTDPGLECVEMRNVRDIKDYQTPLIYAFKCLAQGYNCNFNHMCSVCALNTEVSMCQLAPSKAAGIFSTLMYSC